MKPRVFPGSLDLVDRAESREISDLFQICLSLARTFCYAFIATVKNRINCASWRGGRVVEGAALEMLFRGNSNEGSNPSLSV